VSFMRALHRYSRLTLTAEALSRSRLLMAELLARVQLCDAVGSCVSK